MKINDCEKACEGRRLRSGKETGASKDDILTRALIHYMDNLVFNIWLPNCERKCRQCGYGLAMIKFVHKYHEALRTSTISQKSYLEYGKKVNALYRSIRYDFTYDTCKCGFAYTQVNPTQTGYTYIYHQLENAVKLFEQKHCLDFK